MKISSDSVAEALSPNLVGSGHEPDPVREAPPPQSAPGPALPKAEAAAATAQEPAGQERLDENTVGAHPTAEAEAAKAATGASTKSSPIDGVSDVALDAAEPARRQWTGPLAGEAPPSPAMDGHRAGLDDENVPRQSDDDDFYPSPSALGWPDPTDPVDAAVQRASTGTGSEEDVLPLLAVSQVAVLQDSGGQPLTARAPGGTPVVPVFTSETHLNAICQLESRVVAVRHLVEHMPEGHSIYVNPTGVACMLIDAEALKAAIGSASQPITGDVVDRATF
ncbi:type VII secretion system-associated protein [Streptomyces sp. NPDC093675]|uniref:type VII secretion system-associated protein n=1 Tax=Streptomyces sp. NPDC093675 TaxID=3366049 RepID=UPI00381B293A